MESYFKGNRGNVGSVMNFCVNLLRINAIIFKCVFIENQGKSKSYFSQIKNKLNFF